MAESSGFIEIDLFPEDVDSLDHPDVVGFREVLENAANAYDCSVLSFEIDHGTVAFALDSEALVAEILRVLEEK
jgi:hypothetical protein